MSYEDALSDLKSEFGKRKLISPQEAAPHISKSPAAVAKLIQRDRFPIKLRPVGGRGMVSVYDLAHYVGDPLDDDGGAQAASSSKTPKTKAKRAEAAGQETSKTVRQPPLRKVITAMRQRMEHTRMQLDFEHALFTELEAMAFQDSVREPSAQPALRRRAPRV